MNFIKTNFNGDTNVGLYGFATDKYCLLGANNKKIKPVLKVPVFTCRILNLDFTGIFIAGNSNGIIINDTIEEYEIHRLKSHFDMILVLDAKYTAMGNLIMMNDSGAIISPLIKKYRREISGFFGVPCESTKIAGQNIIGNLGIATNRGCLVHQKIKKSEKDIIERVLRVKSDIGTVSFGSPYPRAGIIANSNGFAVSDASSGPEMGRITEALGFL